MTTSTTNIYAAPVAEVHDLAGGTGLLSDIIVKSLRQTRPWVLLMAILGFASSVLMVIMAIPMLLGSGWAEMTSGVWSSDMFIGMGVFYLILGLITLLASLHLMRFAAAIKRVLESMNPQDLDDVIRIQAKFWRLIGILSLISVILMIIMILVGIFVAMQVGV